MRETLTENIIYIWQKLSVFIPPTKKSDQSSFRAICLKESNITSLVLYNLSNWLREKLFLSLFLNSLIKFNEIWALMLDLLCNYKNWNLISCISLSLQIFQYLVFMQIRCNFPGLSLFMQIRCHFPDTKVFMPIRCNIPHISVFMQIRCYFHNIWSSCKLDIISHTFRFSCK